MSQKAPLSSKWIMEWSRETLGESTTTVFKAARPIEQLPWRACCSPPRSSQASRSLMRLIGSPFVAKFVREGNVAAESLGIATRLVCITWYLLLRRWRFEVLGTAKEFATI